MARRRSLAPADCLSWSRSIQRTALGLLEYRSACAVVLYSPVQNEVDTSALLNDALRVGKKIYYPKLSLPGMPAFARIRSAADLVPGRYSIPEPAASETLEAGDDNGLIAFVPGLLFDRQGNRVGRGGGWYDRALRPLGRAGYFVGLAYGFQLIDEISVQSWDQKVHLIITEKDQIDCGGHRMHAAGSVD